jgi:hypothetical protein
MAVVDYISVNVNANKTVPQTQPQALLNFKNALAQVLMQGPILLDIANHNFDDSVNPPNFAAFEMLFGIPTGTGQAVFDMINGTMGALTGTMQNSQAVTLVSRVG